MFRLRILAVTLVSGCTTLQGLIPARTSRPSRPATPVTSSDSASAEPTDEVSAPASAQAVAAPTPSTPAAESWPKWRKSKRAIDEACTVKGAVSMPCFNLYVKDEDAQSAKGPRLTRAEDEALRCMLTGAKVIDSPGLMYSTGSAESLIEAGEESSPEAKECFRITALAAPDGDWKRRAAEMRSRGAWTKKMQVVVKDSFKRKCGVDAALDGPSFSRLSIERSNPRNTKIFYEGKDGTGDQITVKCSGEYTMRMASGGSMHGFARTWDDDAKAMDEVNCLQRCANSNLTCLSNGKNITVPACRNACLPSCQ